MHYPHLLKDILIIRHTQRNKHFMMTTKATHLNKGYPFFKSKKR